MDILFGSVGNFTHWLTLHTDIAYGILFLGAYFETLIGTCFFIPGEIFFLSGAALAGAQILSLPLVLLSLYGGAMLGDNSSFYIGRRIGSSVFKDGRVVLSVENYRKGEALFAKYGNKAIFFARIMGPLSWIMPFLAGIYKVPYRVFLPYNTAGVLVGVSQFIIAGYFFGRYGSDLVPYVQRYLFLLLALSIVGFVIYRYWHGTRKP